MAKKTNRDIYYKNASGYNDPTAGEALCNLDRIMNNKATSKIKEMRKIIDDFCEASGFEVLEPVVLRDKHTGKCYY